MGIAPELDQRYRSLFERHHREVYAYCRRRADPQTAADCFSETFLVAWRRLDDVPDDDAALGWLYAVARRVLANEFRRTRRSRRLLTRLRDNEPVSNPGPDVVVVRKEEDRTMFQALGRLRPRDQELLRLAWWEELPHVAIADLLGCSPNAATHRIQRAAQRAVKEYQRLERAHKPAATHRQPSEGGSI